MFLRVRTLFFYLRMRFFSVGFPEIKSFLDYFVSREDHEGYELILGVYDPSIEFNKLFTSRRFVGVGKGRFTLNAYREVVLSRGRCFEKIYSSESIDWRKCCFFYSDVAPIVCAHGLVVPGLSEAVVGDRLTVSLFEFFDILPIEQDAYFEYLFSVVEVLSSVDCEALLMPEDFKRLDLHFGFDRCLRKTQVVLEQFEGGGSVLLQMKARCEAMPRFIGHGDLSLPNMGVGSIVIDWDNFGFYPPGFDLALGAVLAGELLDADALNAMAERVFPSFAKRCTFEMLWFSFVFFYCVFLSARQAVHKRYVYSLLVERFI
jgi:hypothetical protein